MTNVMVKTCLNQKIIKNSNLIQAMKNSVCPKSKDIRRPNFSESRICPNIYRMFWSVDWTHDMIIVKWHLFIWHKRKLRALTNAPRVQYTQTGQWVSTLLHANYSASPVYFLHPRQFIFALSCRRRSFCTYYNPLSAKNDILKIFLCIWLWQMWWWKHVLTRKL